MSGLFSEFGLGDLALPNRLVMAPMTRRRAAEGKVPTALNALYYAQRASAGLIISESIEVDPLSHLDAPTPPGLFTDAQEAGWAGVTQAVHAAGGRIFAQLSHMGRAAHTSQLADGAHPVGPSALAAEGRIYTSTGPQPYAIPRELGIGDIAVVIAQFVDAAARARRAGFDGIELQGANGYLIDQFLRDGSNRRTDRYGGSVEARARLLVEIIHAVKAEWPTARIAVRISPLNPFQGMSDSDPVGHFSQLAAILSPLDLAYLHVVAPPHPTDDTTPITPLLRRAFAGPLILAGKYDRARAHEAIEQGRADLIAFGEPFLANPDLPERFRTNAPLNTPDRSSFYTEGERGYTDYPTLPSS